ncbi:Bifunctional pantoate ligase/cytidylate kinase (Includes: Pantoate--beta-alanine ligase; Cytidylate kinase) [Planktothrix serta PCC 8927]|uniref:Bifunctional pantoate ligase/cytidylate kinase n=1 Tax=Planktothrix serta PCC 8927 TaxID=671068 RepID=A0A7Z9C1H2_9CYAN|nr:bifunctional pantoate--beta-alanine ligase/(d)CMP kinase [Planktothrix serta]VXD25360.1 Bifunctional pantoate ligase/cytidylate kinase (Includes: Pantoate--beta-alanine ligase; Cytidylate kinase) [Planktothrix serta PCC 8927]
MRLLTSVAALRCYLRSSRTQNPDNLVGLVPTMGGLHLGHLSLIQRAKAETSGVVVTIFVNPLQFGPNEDFQKYPRALEADLQQCEQAGVDVVFAPSIEEMYQSSMQTMVIPPGSMMSGLCGGSRPGHFQGVATVVTKLLNLVQPDRAYFGQKDAQQVAIIQRLVQDLNWPIEIISCPIVRESSGLAYSSRNQYLTTSEQQQATVLYRALLRGQERFNKGFHTATEIKQIVQTELDTEPGVQVEYIELVEPNSLIPLTTIETTGLLAIAARVGKTRLIDNLILRHRQPIIAIDGPAGAGKSTVTRKIAQALGLLYLDTGAMYRAVTWLVLQSGIAIDDEPAIAEIVSQCQIELIPDGEQPRTVINGEDVTEAIRSLEVTANVSAIASQWAVRQALVKQQQAFGRQGGIVAEGRDIGTTVFPDAELKIFLTASVQERAKRRLLELHTKGKIEVTQEQLEQDIAQRDQLDSNRAISPLRKASDAVEIQTDNLTIDDVIQRVVGLYSREQGTA